MSIQSRDAPRPARNWLARLLAFAGQPRPAAQAELAFPPNFLASLERLRLAALRALGGGLREGHRLGAYKGGQLEFHGHRNYTPGDDLRYVDWNTYARLGRPYVKEFAREEAGVLHLLLDATPSMALGVPSKWTFARRVAALFWHVAVSSQDVACLYIFGGPPAETGGLPRFPARGRSGGDIRACLDFLERAALFPAEFQSPIPNSQSAIRTRGALETAVEQFLRSGPARGRAIISSDFWQPETEIAAAVARLAAAGFDACGLQVLAPEEIVPQVQGEILARSMEDPDEIKLSGGSGLQERYGRELERHRGAVEAAFRRHGGKYLMQRCDAPIERVLIDTLRQQRWVL